MEYIIKNNIENEMVKNLKERLKSPSTVINNFFAVSMLASELLKFFAKDYANILSVNHVIGIHHKDFRLEKLEVMKKPNCEFCKG